MKWGRWAVLAALTVAASVVTVRWSLRAQDHGARRPLVMPIVRQDPAAPADPPAPGGAAPSVQDALLRPLDLPFAEPTTLTELQKFLAGALGAPVVLDLSALDRLDIDAEETVQLEVKGVRLKTGLKLLLDQVGMTFRVVPEDNLLILTDAAEGGEPVDRALRELKALHLEMHDLRDAIDDLRDLVEEDLGIEPEGDPKDAALVRGPGPKRRSPHSRAGIVPRLVPDRPATAGGGGRGMRPAQDPAEPSPRPTGPRGVARTDAPPAPEAKRTARGWTAYLGDPRTAVLFFLSSALVIGGGRKGLQAIRARRAVAAISGTNPDPGDVEAAGDHGRAGLVDLFRLLTTAEKPAVRDAAGRALARLWRLDDLIAEEEKAVVRRGFVATWHARRKYPRGLHVPITISLDFGVPFLGGEGRGISSEHLHWSYRITGTERAGLEEWSDFRPGPQAVSFEVFPDDFTTLGPHRLVLQARVKTVGLTDAWELDLPHIPFAFEFDPNLAVDALLTLPDDARAAKMAGAITLAVHESPEPPVERLFPREHDLALRNEPDLVLHNPLPADLAHRLAIEFEGIPGQWAARSVVHPAASRQGPGSASIPLGTIADFPAGLIERPGPHRIRAILTADASLGWASPEIRSIWPGAIMTDWVEIRVIRR